MVTNDRTAQQEALVNPQLLKGFQDLLPEDMIARSRLVESIKKVFERYGFVPIDTPALEYLVTLIGTGGEDTNKLLFRLKSPEHEDIALRFDLTVPFARMIAQYPEKVRLPFRRYHVAPVWRADKPGAGRFRQFMQCDFDAAGSDSVAVDAEIVCVMCDAMTALGVSDYQVQINNRKVVDSLLISCGITDVERQKHVLRVIDKLSRIGIEGVRKELGEGRTDESGDKIPGVHLNKQIIEQVEKFISIQATSRAQVIAGIRGVLPDNEMARTALAEMELLAEALEGLKVDEEHGRFVPSLARGLDYYTGPVFETVLAQAPQFGSVMGGGRYDDLVRRFLAKDIPATGASIGLDRLLAALKHINAVSGTKTTTKVLITVMPGIAIKEYLAIALELRRGGVCTEVFFGSSSTRLADQLAHANAQGIPIAVIAGEDEFKSNTVSVKDLRVGMEQRAGIAERDKYRAAGRAGQKVVPRQELLVTVRSMLEGDSQ